MATNTRFSAKTSPDFTIVRIPAYIQVFSKLCKEFLPGALLKSALLKEGREHFIPEGSTTNTETSQKN